MYASYNIFPPGERVICSVKIGEKTLKLQPICCLRISWNRDPSYHASNHRLEVDYEIIDINMKKIQQTIELLMFYEQTGESNL